MKKYALARHIPFFGMLLLCSCWLSCKVTPPVESNALINVELKSIICKNRAEKIAGVGSLNDEILLLVYHKDKTTSHRLLWQFPIMQFAKEEEQKNLSVSLTLTDEDASLKLVLIEMDTERKSEEIIIKVSDALNRKVSNEEMKTLLEDDDFLGVKNIPLNMGKKDQSVSFWGVHLFDEYSYEVNYSLN